MCRAQSVDGVEATVEAGLGHHKIICTSVSRTLVFGCRRFGFEGDFVIAQTPPSLIRRQKSCLDEPGEF